MAMMMALVTALSVGLIAQAETISAETINPQQKGHVYYLDSVYGETEASRIIAGYEDSPTADHQRSAPQAPASAQSVQTTGAYAGEIIVNAGSPIIIPHTSSTTPQWTNLRVGDLFTVDGQTYQVGRFAVVAGSNVLVGYPVTANGYAQVSQPRYFYL